MLRSLPFQLVAVIIFVLLFGAEVPLRFITGSYTFSVIFKELLGMVLPFMVFFFVLVGILSFKKNAPTVLGIMLTAIFCSNGIVALCSYFVMQLVYPAISCNNLNVSFQPDNVITPLFAFSVPYSISAVHALLAAVIIGLIGSFYSLGKWEQYARQAKQLIERLLQTFFIPFLPLYILGFLLKIRYEGLLSCLMQQYGGAFVLIVSMQIIYLGLLYFVVNSFDIKKTIKTISNALPSYVTAFSTMSSTATIPVSSKAAIQNTGNRALADVAIPIMANVHLLGDSIGTPILAMVTMSIFQGFLPSLMQYIPFVFYFCCSMFAASGIPGGGILVMIPVLKSYLGFTPEMVSIMVTIYFLMDSFGTAANVMGDGALVIFVNRILKRLKIA